MIRFADISEHQEGADLRTYRKSNDVLIIRAHNGSRTDNQWLDWRREARMLNFTVLGFYQYLTATRDSVMQAHEFVRAVGPILDNEFVILDYEEEAGNDVARAEAWFAYVDMIYKRPASLYSSESFCNEHLGGWGRWHRPRWIAAYRATEPTEPHEWWQNTETATFPGIPSPTDGSLFDGASKQLSVVTAGIQPFKSADVVSTIGIAGKVQGRFEVFVETASGEVFHRWQIYGIWGHWKSLGTPKEGQ